MSDRSGILPRALATPDSLAGRLLADEGPVRLRWAHDLLACAPRPADLAAGSRLPAEAFGTSTPAVARKLARVLEGGGLVVTTGHQPLLFVGPLYVLYKAATAIALASEVERVSGVPTVPVIWIASDDHDWDEVGRAWLLDGDGDLVTLTLEPPDGFAGRSAGPAPLPEAIDGLCARVSEVLPNSEFTKSYIESLREHYAPGRAVAEAFAGLLSALLAGQDFAWLDAGGGAVKRAAVPLFDRLLEGPEAALDAERAGAVTLRDAGFEPPITPMPGALPLFYDTGERRERLYADGDGFRAGRDGDVEPAATWRARLADRPDAFSPNVSSRPALESFLLPVAATALGPGEIAYWSQLPPLFDRLGVRFPAIQPRASWIFVEPRIARLLERLELVPEALEDGGRAAISGLTSAGRPPEVEAGLAELRQAIEGGLASLETPLMAVYPGLRSSLGKMGKALFDAVSEIDRQIESETRTRLDTQIARVRRVAANLFPGGRPQERVLNPLYFLSRYGQAFIEDVRGATEAWIRDSLARAERDG